MAAGAAAAAGISVATGSSTAEGNTTGNGGNAKDKVLPPYTGANSSWLQENYEEQSSRDAKDVNVAAFKAIQDYSLDGHRDINKLLDGQEISINIPEYKESVAKKADLIADAIEGHHLPQDTQLYRGQKLAEIFGSDAENLSFEELCAKYTGTYYRKKCFTSSTTSLETARRFAAGRDKCIISIHAPKGATAICMGGISCYEGFEEEVLIQKESVYRIEKIEMRDGKIFITVTLVGRM